MIDLQRYVCCVDLDAWINPPPEESESEEEEEKEVLGQ
jgi:hypothetical protein